MAEPPEGIASDLASEGRARLAGGDWAAARVAFVDALARVETPQALDGLSWAAWWLDDAQAVFDAREGAYRLYRRRGDRARAARMATWLAADHLDFRGAVAVAGGWLARAGRLLETVEPGPEHGWLAFHEGYVAQLGGDTAKAEELAARALVAGQRFDVPDLEMLGLALQGAALVARSQVAEGMRCLDEATATALAGEATIPISGAWACCFLVSACTAVLDYERAFAWCDRIAEFAQRYGSRYMLAFCRAEYGAVHLWRGQWTDAEEMLEASIEDFLCSRPALVGGPRVVLAELRRRQSRVLEAESLLDQAGPSARAQLCRARLALDKGDARRAVELAERLLRQTPSADKLARAPALELLVCARTTMGELEAAGAASASLRETERMVGSSSSRPSDRRSGSTRASAGSPSAWRRLTGTSSSSPRARTADHPQAPRSTATNTCSLSRAGAPCSGNLRAPLDLVAGDEVARSQDEHLADHVRVLLVAAHEADHATPGGPLDHALEALAHDLLERHALLDDGVAATALEQGPLDAREAAAKEADHEVVVVVGLGTGGPPAVELLQQRDQPIRDSREDLAALDLLLLGGDGHRGTPDPSPRYA
jgi:tetratricopeptide (TPR) repeat protein